MEDRNEVSVIGGGLVGVAVGCLLVVFVLNPIADRTWRRR